MVEEKIRELYRIVDELESFYPEKHFTLDGILLGNLGEVYAAEKYGLTLLEESAKTHDATTSDGKYVQIKVTQGRQVGLYEEPEYLLVLQVHRDGSFTEVYYGPGKAPWMRAGKQQKNGQRYISIARLSELQSFNDNPNDSTIA